MKYAIELIKSRSRDLKSVVSLICTCILFILWKNIAMAEIKFGLLSDDFGQLDMYGLDRLRRM